MSEIISHHIDWTSSIFFTLYHPCQKIFYSNTNLSQSTTPINPGIKFVTPRNIAITYPESSFDKVQPIESIIFLPSYGVSHHKNKC